MKQASLKTTVLMIFALGMFLAGITAIMITALTPKGQFYGVQMKRGVIFLGIGLLLFFVMSVTANDQDKKALGETLGAA